MSNGTFLVLVIPPGSIDKRELADLAQRLNAALRDVSTTPALPVGGSATLMCLLVTGDFKAITDAVDRCWDSSTRAAVLQVGTEHATWGLSAVQTYLDRRR